MKKSIFVMFIVAFLSTCAVSICGESADINKLISALESGSLEHSREAARELEKIGPEAKPAIPALLKALKSRDVSLRLSAEKALVSIGKDAAVQIVKLDSHEFIENVTLVSVLKEIGEIAVPIIIKEIKETESSEKRMHLLLALGLMGEKATSALPVIEEMEKREKNFETKTLLQLTIAQIKYGVKGIKDFLEKTEKEADVLAGEEARLTKDAEELAKEIVKPKLTIDSPALDILMKELGDDTDKAISQLAYMIDKGDLGLRALSILGICKIGEKSIQNKTKVIPYLKKNLEDESSLICTISAAMLVKLGEKEEATPVLINTLIHSKQDKEIMFALGSLAEGEIIVKDREALTALEKMLSHKNMDVVLSAALVLINSGDADVIDIVIPALVEMLKSHESTERLAGAGMLWRMGARAKPAAIALKDAQRRETDLDVKSIMNLAIMAIGKTEDDIDSILADLKSTDKLIIFSAFSKLEKLDSAEKRKALPSLLQMIRTTADESMKDSLIYAICKFGSEAEYAFPALTKLLEESIKENNKERQFMIAGVLCNAEAAPILLKLLSSEDRRVSNSAQLSLQNLGPKAKAIIPELIEMAKNPKLSHDALSALRYIGLETEEQANTLAELLESDSEEIAFDAWFALEIGKKVAVSAFIKKLNSPKQLARLLAVGGLGEIGEGDSRVVPALKSALEKEKDERVIQEINSSLEKLAKTAE